MTEAKRDGNSVTALLGTSNADGVTVLPVYVDSSTNRMLVNATITGTVTVTGAGGASMVDDAAFAVGVDSFAPVGGMFDDVSPDTINEGDGGIVRMSANRNLYVTLRDSAGNERGMVIDANGFPTVNINGTVTVGSHAVTNAGTFVVQENGAALTALQLLDDVVATDDAAVTPATQKLAMIGFVFDDTTPDTVNEGDAGYARMSANRNLYVTLRDAAGNERGLNIDANGETGVSAIRNALPAGTNDIGKVGHNITGIAHGVTTVTTAGTDVVLAASTACKKVVIQAQTDNTGLIAVGGSGVDATVATGTGVILYPGDVFELEIDNLNDVYIDSTVNGEGVRYTYFT